VARQGGRVRLQRRPCAPDVPAGGGELARLQLVRAPASAGLTLSSLCSSHSSASKLDVLLLQSMTGGWPPSLHWPIRAERDVGPLSVAYQWPVRLA
jgi:hypothetical protein